MLDISPLLFYYPTTDVALEGIDPAIWIEAARRAYLATVGHENYLADIRAAIYIVDTDIDTDGLLVLARKGNAWACQTLTRLTAHGLNEYMKRHK